MKLSILFQPRIKEIMDNKDKQMKGANREVLPNNQNNLGENQKGRR